MHAIQSAVPTPQVEIVKQRATRRQILRDRAPLASRAQNVHDPVHHLTDVNAALVPSDLGRWNQCLDMRPLVVSQVAGISQPTAVVAPTVFFRPHRWPPPNQATTLESQKIHRIQGKIPDRHLVVRCRTGTVPNSEFGTIPALRSTAPRELRAAPRPGKAPKWRTTRPTPRGRPPRC